MMRRFFDPQPGDIAGSTIGDGLTEGPGHGAKMSEAPATGRGFTFGEKAVGLSFNPGGNQAVVDIKRAYADIIDYLHNKRQQSTNADEQRMLSVAITESQTAQMWAVKAVTWNF